MSQVLISRHDVQRMMESTQPAQITAGESRRRMLKKVSDERVSYWPNTLEATRKKKENFRFIKAEQDELQRQEVDRQEAELQKKLRIDAIKRANTILYEQTDKMKNLRSCQMYCDVLADREDQVSEKDLMKSWESERNKVFHIDMLRQVKEGEAREKAEGEARSKKEADIAVMQTAQLDEYRTLFIKRLQGEKEEGVLLLKKAEEDVLEDQNKAAERNLKARMQCEEMQLANQHLKKLRLELAMQEQLEDDKRKAELKRKEAIGSMRLKMEQDRFEERQQIRQRMIDKACLQLAAQQNTEETRLAKQADEVRQKEDDLENLRQTRQRRQKEAIDRSRHIQLQMRQEKRDKEQADTKMMVEHWKLKNAEIEFEEADEAESRRKKNMEIRATQEAQKAERKAKEDAGAAATLLQDQQTRSVMQEDDERFNAIAHEAYEVAREQGRNTFMIEKCLKLGSDNALQPATMGSRV